MASPNLRSIPVEQLSLEKSHTREEHEYKPGRLTELVAHIREHGVKEPIVVRVLSEKTFGVVDGRRRTVAARLAGVKEVPAYVQELDNTEAVEYELLPFLHRKNLNPIEMANGLQALMDLYKGKVEKVVKATGKTSGTIYQALRLNKLSNNAKALVSSGVLSFSHALRLTTLPKDKQDKVCAAAVTAENGKPEAVPTRRFIEIVNEVVSSGQGKGRPPKKTAKPQKLPDATEQLNLFAFRALEKTYVPDLSNEHLRALVAILFDLKPGQGMIDLLRSKYDIASVQQAMALPASKLKACIADMVTGYELAGKPATKIAGLLGRHKVKLDQVKETIRDATRAPRHGEMVLFDYNYLHDKLMGNNLVSLSETGRVKAFEYRGKKWAIMGGVGNTYDAYAVIPQSQLKGKRNGTSPYHGERVLVKGKHMVLSKPVIKVTSDRREKGITFSEVDNGKSS